MRVDVSLEAHQLANDLRIRLAAEQIVVRPCMSENLDECAMEGTLARSLRQEDRPVDIEQDEFHVRVSRSPLMTNAAPPACHRVGVSPSMTHATITAMIGCRLEYIAVRVGPMTRTPLYQK